MVVTNPLGVSLVISSSKNKQIINHSPDTHTLTAAPKVSPSLAPSQGQCAQSFHRAEPYGGRRQQEASGTALVLKGAMPKQERKGKKRMKRNRR